MSNNIGFVSTRFAGTDGVSLEADKWADILEKTGTTVSGLPESWASCRPTVFWCRKHMLNMPPI